MMGKDRANSPSDWPVEGLLVHAAGEGPNGFRVVDVWESEQAARRFGEKLAPYLRETGITAEPELYQAHAFVSAGRKVPMKHLRQRWPLAPRRPSRGRRRLAPDASGVKGVSEERCVSSARSTTRGTRGTLHPR
jgi:hypothetical protein